MSTFREVGRKAIEAEGAAAGVLMPLEQDGVVFQQMFEYVVADFEAEAGFFSSVFGLPSIALTEDYALFQHPQQKWCFSFRKVDDAPSVKPSALKLLFMTTDIPAADSHLDGTGVVPDREIRKGSPVQDVIYFNAPSGLAIEIWQDPIEG